MRNQRLLEGEVVEPNGDADEISRLRDELGRALGERNKLQAEVTQLRRRVNQVDAPAAKLRETLEPLYRALQSLWGELEVIDPQPTASTSSGALPVASGGLSEQQRAAWESWKNKMPGVRAKIIEALMVHGTATVEQLVVLTQITRKPTIYEATNQLKKSGLIVKNGNAWALKQL